MNASSITVEFPIASAKDVERILAAAERGKLVETFAPYLTRVMNEAEALVGATIEIDFVDETFRYSVEKEAETIRKDAEGIAANAGFFRLFLDLNS